MLVVAHRGASHNCPENTVLAFEQALVEGADGIELDVHLHKSGELIVCHDHYIDRISSLDGDLNDFTLKQLQQIALPQNQHISLLSEILRRINGRCIVNIELKTADCDKNTLARLCRVLEQTLYEATTSFNFKPKQLIVSSFNHPLIGYLANKISDFPVSPLTASCPLSLSGFATKLNASGLHVTIDCLNKEIVDDAKKMDCTYGCIP